MTVAYIAYKNLSPGTRAEVDRLIQMNPMYATWTKNVSDDQKGLVAFVYAATWPDCIKRIDCAAGYLSDGGDNPPGHATDAQNIGYKDMLMHKYWHIYDSPYAAGAPGKPAKQPNTLTGIELLAKAIGTNEGDDVKSYDVVWLTHLVGDIHQPLHAVSGSRRTIPMETLAAMTLLSVRSPTGMSFMATGTSYLGNRRASSRSQAREIL